jgi:hypothetical protein
MNTLNQNTIVLLIVFINYGYNFKIFWRFNAHFSKFVNPSDLQMLLGRDGQLYVMDPLNADLPSSEILSGYSQEERKENIKGLLEWRDTSLSVLKAFDQNKGVHVIFDCLLSNRSFDIY